MLLVPTLLVVVVVVVAMPLQTSSWMPPPARARPFRRPPITTTQRALPDLAAFYATGLQTHPVIFKGLTAGVIAAAGDGVAQRSERRGCRTFEGKEPAAAAAAAVAAEESEAEQDADGDEDVRGRWHRRRTLAAFLDGCLLSGPFLHFGYAYLEQFQMPPAACVLFDELLGDPVSTATYLLATSVCEGKRLVPLFKRRFWPAMLGGLTTSLLCVPVQYASFRWGPPAFRVLVVNLCDFFWTCVVSRQSHKAESRPASPP